VQLVGIAAVACRARSELPVRHYQLHGVVVAVDVTARRLVVRHDSIPGFMGAMTMTYRVKDPSGLHLIHPRDTITADVVAQGLDAWLAHVVRVSSDGEPGP
jgi:protein SCO1/2